MRRKFAQSPTRPADVVSPQATQMLVLATAGFAVAFWAWALLAPLGATLREQLSLYGVPAVPRRRRAGR